MKSKSVLTIFNLSDFGIKMPDDDLPCEQAQSSGELPSQPQPFSLSEYHADPHIDRARNEE